MLWKYFYIKNLYLRIKSIHRKNIPVCNFGKECRNETRQSHINYKTTLTRFLKYQRQKREAYFHSSTLTSRAVLTQHKCNIVELTLLWERLLLAEKAVLILSNQHWLRSWYNRREDLLNLMAVFAGLIWALLVDVLLWNLLGWKSLHHIKVSFIQGMTAFIRPLLFWN